MKRALWALGPILTMFVVLAPGLALAQDNSVSPGVLAGLGLIPLIIFAVIYVYVSLALQTIATKTNTANAWMAWIPIVNIFSDVEHCPKARVVVHPVPDTSCEPRDVNHRMDGDRRTAWQTELVGHHVDRAGHELDHAGLLGLVGLAE